MRRVIRPSSQGAKSRGDLSGKFPHGEPGEGWRPFDGGRSDSSEYISDTSFKLRPML